MSYAFIFPGQGSQSTGMGREVYEAFPEAREVFEEIDDVLHQKLSALIFDGPQDILTLTENAQPALMAVSMAILRVLETSGNFSLSSHVRYLAGHSLGEYSALCAGKAFSLKDTARLLKIRGRSMQEAVPLGEGSMAAILGLDLETVANILENLPSTKEICVIANDNASGQVVISGHTHAVERALQAASEQGAKRSVLLPVSAPFHSPLMAPAALKMQDALTNVTGKNLSIPLIANVTAEPVQNLQDIKTLLCQQVTGQVRWRESVLKMESLGVTSLVEIGAGKVLTGLAKRISPNLTTHSLNTPQDIESFLASFSSSP